MDVAVVEQLERDGFLSPTRLFEAPECARLIKGLLSEKHKPKVWQKAAGASSRSFHAVATDPRLVALVTPLIGDDVILWGADLIVKTAGAVHRFHTDVEFAAPEGGFVTVWIGLENTTGRSGLKFVRGSHRYGKSVQQADHDSGVKRDESSDETTLTAARRFDPGAEIVQPEVSDGEALVFDGRIWHGSANQTSGTRTALLLQYARADRAVFVPTRFEWPFAFKRDVRPPVILVSGAAPIGVNRVVRAPGSQGGAVANGAFELRASSPAGDERFVSLPHFRGFTPRLADMEAHSSMLMPGATPHELHQHKEEEILVVMHGSAQLLTATDTAGKGKTATPMGPGDFAYYPAFQPHTLTNASDAPVVYSMLKWTNEVGRRRRSDRLALVKCGARLRQGAAPTGARRVVLDTSSRWLERIRCHLSVVAPGEGYDEHDDRHDVALFLIEGSIDTLGRTVTAPAVLYHPAGELHGLRAVGAGPARYLAFEFDGEKRRGLLRQVGRALGRLLRWTPNRAGRPGMA